MTVSYYRGHMGWIEVICGSMFSGKTEELIRRLKRSQIARQRVQIFKPKIDNRYAENEVVSHNRNRIESIVVDRPSEILEKLDDSARVVAVDEAQFFDKSIVSIVQRLANRGIRVIVAGLDQDFLGEPFGPMPELLSIAEQVTKLNAICVMCGNPASKTQRLTGKSEGQIAVGGSEMYEARCRMCHQVEGEAK